MLFLPDHPPPPKKNPTLTLTKIFDQLVPIMTNMVGMRGVIRTRGDLIYRWGTYFISGMHSFSTDKITCIG